MHTAMLLTRLRLFPLIVISLLTFQIFSPLIITYAQEAESIEITQEPINDLPTQSWSLNADGTIAVTTANVELGVNYVLPQNKSLSVTFTKLPSQTSPLTVKEITLTAEQQQQAGALTNKAYDITTDMVNGTFTYNLTLPLDGVDKSKDLQVKYAESLSDISNAQAVENKTDFSNSEAVISNLNHFTIFYLSADTNGTNGTGTYITLTSPNIPKVKENQTGQIGLGTIILLPPTGFEFNDTWPSTTSVQIWCSAFCGTAANNINGATSGSYAALTSISTSEIVFTVTSKSNSGSWNQLWFQNIQMRPIAGSGLSSGGTLLFSGGTASMNDQSSGFGVATYDYHSDTFDKIAGEVNDGLSIVDASPAVIDADNTQTSTITVTLNDSYGNPVKNIGVTLAETSGLGTATINTISGTTNTDGQAFFTVKSGDSYIGTYTATDIDDSLVITDTAEVGFKEYTPPNVPTNLSIADGAYTNGASINFDWSDETDPSGPVTYYYQTSYTNFTNGGDNGFLSTAYTSGVLSSSDINLTSVADSLYYWQARACDYWGNCSNWSNPWSFSVDSTSPYNADGFSNNPAINTWTTTNNIDISWSVAGGDFGSGLKGYSYSFTQNSSDTPDATTELSDTAMSIPTESLTDGNWYFHIVAVDNAGNISPVSSVGPFLIDTTAPTLPTHLSPNDGAIENGLATTFEWSDVSDSGSSINYSIQLCNDNLCSSVYSNSGTGSSTQLYDPYLPENTYYWQVQACDAVGNCTSWTNTWEITIDNDKPYVSNNSSEKLTNKTFSEGQTFPSMPIRGLDVNGDLKEMCISIVGPVNYNDCLAATDGYDTTWNFKTILMSIINTSGYVYTSASAFPEGVYTINYNFTDEAGNYSDGNLAVDGDQNYTATMTINNVIPQVSLTANTTSIYVGNVISFSNAAFTDPSYIGSLTGIGSADDASWKVTMNYGDGNIVNLGYYVQPSSLTVSAHQYNSPGQYTVKLEVTEDNVNGESKTGTASFVITVNSFPVNNGGNNGGNTTQNTPTPTETPTETPTPSVIPTTEPGVLGTATECTTKSKFIGYVFEDTNGDTLYNESDKGISSVEVELFFTTTTGKTSILKVTSDSTGKFEGDICPGNYEAQINLGTLPTEYQLTGNQTTTIRINDINTRSDTLLYIVQKSNVDNTWLWILLVIIALVIITYVYNKSKNGGERY